MNEINRRLELLRELMRREHLSAFIFPSTDAHQSEYVASHWQGRYWISGFCGSAGTAVVTLTSAALWTDSRYFLAAEEQLRDTEFQLMRLKIEGTPTIAEWLGRELAGVASPEVGIDGWVNSYTTTISLKTELQRAGGITLRTNLDPLELIWSDRPAIPDNPVEVQSLEYAGESAQAKIDRIRKALRGHHADGILVSALDDIAWTLNLRGTDVHCNPVFVAYLLIASKQTTLFVDAKKLTPAVEAYLRNINVGVKGYKDVEQALCHYPDYSILMDADETNYHLWKKVKCNEIVAAKSPIPSMKAAKNETEIAGYRRAMLRDGVAMVKFLRWLGPAVAAGGETEMSIDRKLTSLRAEQELFRDISFDTIAGYAAHGAIVHYEATPATDAPLKPKGLLLLDSGAQYQDGTTDITRTIPLGPLTDEMRHVYTLVLKAHIQLELVKFPDGASGTQIDGIGRECLWREGYNFLHGTGHGVGSYLNVHEGPHQIRMEWMPEPLKAGMTVTDEPGLYLENKFGVRIENTLLIKNYAVTEFGKFLQMEPLTLCPIATEPIETALLLPEEKEWLNEYHRTVRSKLSPLLGDDDKKWLEEATKPIK